MLFKSMDILQLISFLQVFLRKMLPDMVDAIAWIVSVISKGRRLNPEPGQLQGK